MKAGITSVNLTTGNSDGWLSLPEKRVAHAPRLYCFANAGGSAEVYRQWQPSLSDTLAICPIELPGRGKRTGEPFCESLSLAASSAASAIASAGIEEYCIFGHSLGSVFAFETARILEQAGHIPPRCIFVSGRVAPHIGEENRNLHTASNDTIVTELRRLGGTQEEVLSNESFLDFILTIVRADYKLLETFTPQALPKINIPIEVCCGDTDEDTTPQLLQHWADLTSSSCHVELFNGGHFYLNDQQEALVDHIRSTFQKLTFTRSMTG